MTLVSEVKGRIDSQVPALAGRLGEAADLAALVRDNALPQQSPYGFVLPLGLDGADADVASGAFRQGYTETVGIVLVVLAPGDVSGKRALPTVDALKADVMAALCGWAPSTDNPLGAAFGVRRGRLLPMAEGAVFYQLDVSLQLQLRIIA